MTIRLTYRGELPTARNRDLTWKMRCAFHTQLKRLWGQYPFDVLAEWEKSPESQMNSFIYDVGAVKFVPFFGKSVGVGVDLDILILTGSHPNESIIVKGDIDNRFKRIIDALRCVSPGKIDELSDNIEIPSRCYCLCQDDNIIRRVSAEVGVLLDSSGPKDSLVVVTVKPYVIRAMIDTFQMAI